MRGSEFRCSGSWLMVQGFMVDGVYLPEGCDLGGEYGVPSLWAQSTWPATAEALGLRLYHGDQGPFGHVKRKPTTWASNRPLFELCVKGSGVQAQSEKPDSSCRSQDQAVDAWSGFQSKSWARWAPGVVEVLKVCLRDVLVSGRLCKLKINWAQHVACGHWPPSRLCRDCVLGSAAQRPHRRVSAPQAYTLGLDLPGPYKRSQDELSQRRRYLLTAVYTVPVDVNGRPLLAESQSPDKSGLGAQGQVGPTNKPSHESSSGRAEGDEPLGDGDRPVDEPRRGELAPGEAQETNDDYYDWVDRIGDELLGSGEGLHEPRSGDASGLPEPLGGVFEEGDDEIPLRELEEWFGGAPRPHESLKKGDEKDEVCDDPEFIRMVELVFVEPLDSKSPGEVAGALGRILAQLAVLQLPVVRVHTDAGSEFMSLPFRRFVDSKGLLHTAAAPQDHNANGRVENVVRRLKQQIRTVILANGHDASRWAVAGKAVAAMWRSQTLTKLGWPQPTIVPYGAETQILTRTWHRRRQSEWKPRAEDAVVLCPASMIKHGYVVLAGGMLKLASKLFSVETALAVVAELAVNGFESCKSHGASRLTEGAHHVFGQFVHGGVTGVTNNTRSWPGVASLLARIVRCKVPSAQFTSVVLSIDARTAIHRDVYNHRQYPNHLVTVLAPSKGGGLWVQSVDASPVDTRRTPVGELVGGHVLALGDPISFCAQRWHCVEPWPAYEHRVVLAAYVTGGVEKLSAQHRDYLEQLGFTLPSMLGGAVEQQGGATPCEASKNQKTPKNCKTPNLKNEGVSPVREEQAAKCDCCERDCPVCKRLFVGAALAGSESCSLGAVAGDLAPDSEGEEPGDLCEFGCGNPVRKLWSERCSWSLRVRLRRLGMCMSFSVSSVC